MCRATIEGGRRCASPHPTRHQSTQRAARRARMRERIAALPTATLPELASSLAPGTGQAERRAALAEAQARPMLAEWWTLVESDDLDDRRAAASLPCTDARAHAGFATLALAYDDHTRRALASNPALDHRTLSDLSHDPDDRVRSAAQATLVERGWDAAPASDAAAAFHERMSVTLDDLPHASVTRGAMSRPGWIAPANAAPVLTRIATDHGARLVVHPGTIPGATGIVEIEEIRVTDRGAGSGTAALRAIHREADRHGWALALHPSAELGGDVERLRGWYAREGYAPSAPGADKRLRRNLADWVRYPKGQDNV